MTLPSERIAQLEDALRRAREDFAVALGLLDSMDRVGGRRAIRNQIAESVARIGIALE